MGQLQTGLVWEARCFLHNQKSVATLIEKVTNTSWECLGGPDSMEETKNHLSTDDMLDDPQMFAKRTNKWMNQGVDKVHIIILICVCGLIAEVKYLFSGDHIIFWTNYERGKEKENENQNNTSNTENGWAGKYALGMWQ